MLQVLCVFSSRAELIRTSPREVSCCACLFHETLARSLTFIGRTRPQDGNWQFSVDRSGEILAVNDLVGVDPLFSAGFPKAEDDDCGSYLQPRAKSDDSMSE
jgi:hypothetical protein